MYINFGKKQSYYYLSAMVKASEEGVPEKNKERNKLSRG
jgi:hypothetical protein